MMIHLPLCDRSFYKAWEDFLKHTEDSARVKNEFAERILSEITDPMKLLLHRKDEARKKHLAFAARLLEERNKAYAEKDKLKLKYEEHCDAVETSKLKFEKATDEKVKDRLKKQWNSDIMEMNNAKNDYLLSVNVANAFKKNYYHNQMPTIMDMMQELNETRVNSIRQLCMEFVQLEQNSLNQILPNLQQSMEAMSAVNAQSDSNLFISYHAADWQEPYDFKFEPTLLWKDTDVLVSDEQSQIYLSNKLAKVEERISILDNDLNMKQRELAGLRNLHDAYSKTPSLGNADEVNDNIVEALRAQTALESEKIKLTSTCTLIKLAIGEGAVGKRHSFNKTSFAIPTACDYCQVKIWGLTQHAYSCKECGYNCHAKCELKVPPFCSTDRPTKGRKSSLENLASASSLNRAQSNNIQNGSDSTAANCLYDYSAMNSDELTVVVGDVLKVLTLDDGSGWIRAEKGGKQGLVPASYVQIRGSSSADKVHALYDFDSQQPDELSLKVGDEIEIILRGDDGWWRGRLKDGRSGLFPSTYAG